MKKILIIVTTMCIVIACSKSSSSPGTPPATADCSGDAKSFARDVNPIIQSSCANPGCHGAGSGNGPGELLRYSQIFNSRAGIRIAVASGRMPLNSSLSPAEKNAVLCWIDNGAPEN